MADVVVIGAGVGGLAAAARLAAAGHAVTVCEQAPQVGGKLGEYARDGFRFDTGPSLLTMPHLLAELFADTGAPLATVLELQRVEPVARYRFADGTRLDASADLPTMVAALDRALGDGSGADWLRLLGRGAAMFEAVRGPFLQTGLDGPLALLRQARRLRDLTAVAPLRTLRGLGAGYLRDPRLQMMLDRYATYSGSDPRRAPATLAVVPYVEQAYGVWYVRGGLRRIADALAARAAECGATVRTGADVVGVRVAGGRAGGVVLRDGERLRADVVVANTDASHLYGDLLPRPSAMRRLRRAPRSLSGFALLLGLRGRTDGTAHHTVLFPADYDAEFDALFGRHPRPVPDPTLYVAAPPDPAAAPTGHEAWSVLANAPRQGQGGAVDWDAPGAADAYAERLLRLLADRGLDVRDRVVLRHVVTPADLQRRTRSVGGAIYGTSSNGPRAAFLRPPNRSDVPGLFLVGGSSHPGGGLPLVLLSARIVAELIGAA
ncbi:phytoene desaturase family protein [soil metagenome]